MIERLSCRDECLQPSQDTLPHRRDSPRSIRLHRIPEMPAQRTHQPEPARCDERGLEGPVVLCLRASFDQFRPVSGFHFRNQRLRNTIGAPAGWEQHPSIRCIRQGMPEPAELEVNQPQLVAVPEDIVWTRIAMNVQRNGPGCSMAAMRACTSSAYSVPR